MRRGVSRAALTGIALAAALVVGDGVDAASPKKKPPAFDLGVLTKHSLPPQTLVYYNARIALRERRHQDVLKLWLLRNALESKGETPTHDGDFRSVVWAALSGAGLCHDGFRVDEDDTGAGLWPLALHNWLTRSTSKQPAPSQPRSFSSFEIGFQQRYFSLHDVLTDEELRGVRFARGNCWAPYFALMRLGSLHWLDLDDRLSTGIMMRDLLEKARDTLKHERVRGEVVLETRLFDLDVALAKLAKAAARRETGVLAQVAKVAGISESAMTLVKEKKKAEVRESQYADLLRRSLTWSIEDWFSLSPNRRLALFGEVIDSFGEPEETRGAVEETLLRNIDVLIARKNGAELSQWLGFATLRTAPGVVAAAEQEARQAALIEKLVLGERGEKLLGLGPDTGFTERSVVALRRGTDYLQRGQAIDAMRSFALAMQRSEESRRTDEVHHLAKRWFAYVLAQHRVDDEALAILNEFLTPLDRNELLEVLLWRAAFHADLASFNRIADSVRGGGSLDFRVRQLDLLARGDAGGMWRKVRDDYQGSPHAIYKFSKQLTDELATEALDVRLKNRVTLELGRALLLESVESANRGLRRRIEEQVERMQVLLDSLALYDESPEGRARTLAPGAEAYAGSVRLAPADPLPWPFGFPAVQPPSPFSALELTPVEWIDAGGERVFGWHIHEK